MTVIVASWNVNSIKSRLQHLLPWLAEAKPDIVLLQETKVVDDAFPRMEIEDAGYNILIHGQKTYNGVAILSRFPLEEAQRGLPGENSDEQARYIEALVSLKGSALRVASVYVPNGSEVGSDKYAYKQRFYDRLYTHLEGLLDYEEMTVIGGDYNIAPDAIDVHDPKAWDDTVLFHPDMRRTLKSLHRLGWYDSFRMKNPTEAAYSWWDYRAGAYDRNNGLRIDHLLLSPQASDKLENAWIDEAPRRLEKPSDHTPVLVSLAV